MTSKKLISLIAGGAMAVASIVIIVVVGLELMAMDLNGYGVQDFDLANITSILAAVGGFLVAAAVVASIVLGTLRLSVAKLVAHISLAATSVILLVVFALCFLWAFDDIAVYTLYLLVASAFALVGYFLATGVEADSCECECERDDGGARELSEHQKMKIELKKLKNQAKIKALKEEISQLKKELNL